MALIFLIAELLLFELILVNINHLIFKCTEILLWISSCTFILAVWINAVTNSKPLKIFLITLLKFEQKLQKLSFRINYRKVKRNNFIQIALRYTAIVSLTIYAILFQINNHHQIYSEITRFTTLVLKSAICHEVISLVTIIKFRFEILNKQINKLIFERHEMEKFTILCRICEMHGHLCEVIRLFNDAFGVVLLVMFGVSFLTVVICFFYISGSLQSNDWKYVCLAVSLAAPFVVDTFYVCHVCYKTVETVSKVIRF